MDGSGDPLYPCREAAHRVSFDSRETSGCDKYHTHFDNDVPWRGLYLAFAKA